MGKVASMMMRPIRTFNIENRAERVILQEKPKPAPRHQIATDKLEKAQQIISETTEPLHKKDMDLNERLKNVYVSSHDEQVIEKDKSSSTKLLPQSRVTPEDFEYGYYEPTIIPPGKCTLHQIVTFLENHHNNPEKYNVQYIAAEYKLDENVVGDIIRHFKLYQVKFPKEKKDEDKSFIKKITGITKKLSDK